MTLPPFGSGRWRFGGTRSSREAYLGRRTAGDPAEDLGPGAGRSRASGGVGAVRPADRAGDHGGVSAMFAECSRTGFRGG